MKKLKEKIGYWWSENKEKIKIAGVFLLIGSFLGFVKGVNTCSGLYERAMDKIPSEPNPDDAPTPIEMIDDEELIELIKQEGET